jgi:hypothetical protein
VALSRFVVGTQVTLPGGTATAAADGFGSSGYAGAGSQATQQWADGYGALFLPGMVIVADSSTPGTTPTGAQQLYTALVAAGADLRPYVQGQDDVGHAALAN